MHDLSLADAVEEFFSDPAARTNPYPFYHRLREEAPIYRSETIGAYGNALWLISGFEECSAVLKDWKHASRDLRKVDKSNGGPPGNQNLPKVMQFLMDAMLNIDPPEHNRVRRLVSRAFTPQAIEGLKPNIEAFVNERLDVLEGQGRCELISDLAYPLPGTIVSDMMGIPEEDRLQMKEWSNLAARQAMVNPLPDEVARGNTEITREIAYLRGLITERRAHPGPDLISAFLALDDSGHGLTDDEVAVNVKQTFMGGQETTMWLITNGIIALLENPTEMDKLRSDPTLIGAAIEEMLRYDSPASYVVRVALDDIELGGLVIPRGETMAILVASANRDPRRFEHPDQFDISRRDAGQLSFGGGVHLCIGAALARAEAAIAINAIINRLPDLHLADEAIVWDDNHRLRGPKALYLEWSNS
jgi:cytochrome P450